MNIQQDPARRIRRIHRWLTEYAGIPEFDVLLIGDDDSLHDQRVFELMRLAGLEIDWVCKYAFDVWKSIHREENNAASIALDLERESEVLTDVKAWASAEINELRSELEDAEQERNKFECYLLLAEMNSRILYKTIAEQKARIEGLDRHLERSGYDY
jgi:hypothetical protein